jgi:hypothetical protein
MREGSREAPSDLRRFLVQLFVVHPTMSPEAGLAFESFVVSQF